MFYNLVGSNGLLYNYTDVIDTLTFRALISSNDFGMSAAVGLYQSVLCFITVVIVNKLVGLYDKDYTYSRRDEKWDLPVIQVKSKEEKMRLHLISSRTDSAESSRWSASFLSS